MRRLREASLRLTTAQRRPSVSLTSAFGRVAYPSGFFPSWSDQRTNWTIGAAMQWPVLTGGRQRADEAVARAELEQAQTQLRQTDELATLDARAAWAELVAARATWNASAGTVEQATRAYQIAEVALRRPASRPSSSSPTRDCCWCRREANRAQAARDLQVARARIALLPDLPLGTLAGAGRQRLAADRPTVDAAARAAGVRRRRSTVHQQAARPRRREATGDSAA